MTHHLGRVVVKNQTFNESGGLDFKPDPGLLGGPKFVILNFDSVSLHGGAKLTVELGYGTDVFSAGAGSSFWSRPADTSIGPIAIRITGGTGSARLHKYLSGEPAIPPGQTPGTSIGSLSNPDPFLQSESYQDPIFETRGECNPGFFAWQNAACALPPISDAVKNKVAASVGIIIALEVEGDYVSSCSGTLIGPDLFLTARHCLIDPMREDQRSASVTFDYATACDFTIPEEHTTRFFKVIEEVVAGTPPTGTEPPFATDWVVLRLDAAPGALPSPLTIRDTALMNGEMIFTMHHPNGAVKKTQAGTYIGSGGTDSIPGFDFAGGSSGSALFDSTGQLVGGPLASGGGCTVSYPALKPIKDALANPPAPPVPLDVMLVLDRSGSMGDPAPPAGRTKLEEAQDAASLFVELVREGGGDRLGLVTFSSTATTDRSPVAVATAKPELVGPAPFTSGLIGKIKADGTTSIGDALQVALAAYGSGSTNDRAMLLMTDGLQNTHPMIEEVEGTLGSTKLNAIGFGSDADIDGPLLTRVAHDHHGHFTRAIDGLSLRKFFGLSFGNIFESGAISDPEFLLQASQGESAPHRFDVCGEERITVVLGWDRDSLQAHIRMPSGKLINEESVGLVRGRTWVFWRIPLPHEGERDGTWQLTVDRVPDNVEVQPPPTDVRYFFLVVCSGGPKLVPLAGPRHVYTGDAVDPFVALHYRNRTTPRHAQVELTIEAPRVALGQLVAQAGLRPPSPLADAVDAFHATLQAIGRQSGGALPVATTTVKVPLFDDGLHDDGAMEPDGIYNNRLKDLTLAEGTYHFRAVATYGKACRASREAIWSLSVEPGIDAGRSSITLVNVTDQPDGRRGTLVIVPRDAYGNPLGPGRSSSFTVSPLGVEITGNVTDRGDGSYGINIKWNASVTPVPGVLVQQPERNPVPMIPPSPTVPPGPGRDCNEAAGKLLDCLGLDDPDVKCVRVKSVSVEIDLKDSKCRKDCC